VGWGTCVEFGPDYADDSIDLHAQYALPGEDLELWILGPEPDIQHPLARVGVLVQEEWSGFVG
jgi:hypothetical protein